MWTRVNLIARRNVTNNKDREQLRIISAKNEKLLNGKVQLLEITHGYYVH